MGREGLDSRGCPENDDERKHTAQRMMAWIPEQGSRMTEGGEDGKEGRAWIPGDAPRMTTKENTRHRE